MVDFLLIGPVNAVTYKNVFPPISRCEISLGHRRVVSFYGGGDGANAVWFTSFYVDSGVFLELKEYKSGDYDSYDHFDAINVDRVCDIPDYDGVIGVPITFLEKWCRRQFEIVDARDYRKDDLFPDMDVMTLTGRDGRPPEIGGKRKYGRILIKKR